MKVNFTKKEYLLLLDMLYLSDWVMHSFELNNEKNGYNDLHQKILSLYREMGVEDKIEYMPKMNEYVEADDYSEKLNEKFIEPYEEELFWQELIIRLAKRDLINKIGLDKFEKMDWLARSSLIDECKEVYQKEFETSGLNNLLLIKDSDRH